MPADSADLRRENGRLRQRIAELERDKERLDKLRAHSLTNEWNRAMPVSISAETLKGYSPLGAYYIGRRSVWEEVHHVLDGIIDATHERNTGVKAISLWQPWATLWLLSDPDEKIYETRGWRTPYRGPLLVHAAKKRDGEVRDALAAGPLVAALLRHGFAAEDEPGLHLAFGAIIGRVELIGCRHMDQMPEPSERERAFGLWTPYRYAWERAAKPTLFSAPIPYRGSQGFFEVSNGVLS